MEIFDKIREWANHRGLLSQSTPFPQLAKLTEEVGELAAAISRGKMEDFKDAIGDCVVVLTILAAMEETKIEYCIDAAYDTIKDRKGRMVDGVFIKEQ